MCHSSRFAAWSCLFGLVMAATGCAASNPFTNRPGMPFFSADKTKASAGKKDVAERSAEPGHGEFTTRTKPKNPAKLNLAYAQWQERQGENSEARESYQKVLKHNPKSAEAYVGLARLDIAADRIEQAEKNLMTAKEISPTPMVMTAVGDFCMMQERWPEAVEAYQQVYHERPDDQNARFQLANALAHNGDVRSALPHFAAAVGSAEAHYNVGYILFEQGKWEASQSHFEMAISKNPKLPEAQRMLAKLDEKLNRPQGDPVGSNSQTRLATHTPQSASPQGASRQGEQPTEESFQRNNLRVKPLTYGAAGRNTPASYPKTDAARETLPARRTTPQEEQWANQKRFNE